MVVGVVIAGSVEGIAVGNVAFVAVYRCAAFKRSTLTVSVRLPRSTLKDFGERERTLNGPS